MLKRSAADPLLTTERLSILMSLGDTAFKLSRLDEAIGYWERALKLDPRNPTLNTNLGIAYANQGDTAQAECLLRQVLEDEPHFVGGYVNLASLLYQTDHLTQACDVYRRGLRQIPEHPLLLTNLASLLIEAEKPHQAEPLLKTCTRAHPGHIEAWITLGHLYFSQHRLAESRVYYDYALRHAPENHALHGYLGIVKTRLRDLESACRHFNVFFEEVRPNEDPELYCDCLMHCALLAFYQGDVSNGMDSLKMLVGYTNGSYTLAVQCLELASEGQTSIAITLIEHLYADAV